MADFAPYQDVPPDDSRAISPPPRNMTSPKPSSPRANGARSPPLRVQSPSFQRGTDNGGGESGDYYAPGAGWQHGEVNDEERGRRGEMDVFETRLGLRMDVEACLSYLVLPPVGGVLLLILEHKSDYVRFHAWQSSLLFTFMFIIHVIFSWSSVLSWILFVGDLGLIGWLTFRAYKDAETLDRYQVPFFGKLASQILDDE